MPRPGRPTRADRAGSVPRSIRIARWSIPAGAVLAVGKGVLVVLSPSVLVLAHVMVGLGTAAAKLVAVRAHSDSDPRRGYRRVGWVLSGLAMLYTAMCAAAGFWGSRLQHYDERVAIGIATLAFTELGIAVYGILAARRVHDLVVEAIKRVNLVAALALLVLTQAALMSLGGESDPSRVCGLTGVLVGIVAVATSGWMLRGGRSLPTSRTPLARE